MSLTKLLSAPINLFKKNVITFLIIRRHDLGTVEDKLRYLAVKPSASVFTLRQKVWHLLDLPDYCEEVIILKSGDSAEIPLTDLRKGNDPQHPFILEVWLPKRLQSTTVHNMLTMGHPDGVATTAEYTPSDTTYEEKTKDCKGTGNDSNTTTQQSNETLALNRLRAMKNNHAMNNFMQTEYKKSELSCRISSSSLILKLQGRKSKDNFTTILLKIQNDLSNLSNKLSSLENRIPNA